MMNDYTSNYFTTDDNVKLYYEECGYGEQVILFVHGYTDSSLGFRHVAGYLEKEKYRVICYDLRAHGKSDAPEYGYSMQRYARDLNNLIDHLDLKDIHIIGYSMGVHIIYDYIRQFGDGKIASLILTSMSPNIVNNKEYQLGMKGYTIETAMETITNLNDNYEAEKRKTDPAANSWMAEYPYIFEFYENALNLNQHAMVRLQLSMIANDYWEVLGCITKPVIVIGGETDIYPIATFERTAQLIEGAKLSIIPEQGHLFYLYIPEVYADRIRNFIDGITESDGKRIAT